jgi:hypothetical protein
MAVDPATMSMLMQSMPNMGTLALGAIQTYMGMKGLKELNKQERPNYTVSPEMYNSQQRSFINSKYGFTPQQTGNFNQQLGRNMVGNFRNQINMGGGSLAQALSARGNPLGALNQFASQDAALLNQNIRYNDQMNANIQNQLNRRVGQNIDYRMSDERAVGASLQSGLTNIASGINSSGSNAGGGGQQGAPDYSQYFNEMSRQNTLKSTQFQPYQSDGTIYDLPQ